MEENQYGFNFTEWFLERKRFVDILYKIHNTNGPIETLEVLRRLSDKDKAMAYAFCDFYDNEVKKLKQKG